MQSNRIESIEEDTHTDIVSMSDHSESSCSLGFVADRSRFRRDSTGGDTPQHHFSASINFDEGRPERPQSRSSTTQPSLKERGRHRPSSGSGMLGGEQQPVRRRMPRRPSIDAIKNVLDNNGDLSKVATGGGRMQRRPSFGSLSAHSYDALGHDLADASDDGASPEHGRSRDRRVQRRPSTGSYHVTLKDGDGEGDGGAGGGQRRRRVQRRPSIGSLDPSMTFNQDTSRGMIRRNSSSFGSTRHMEELIGSAGGDEGQQEKPMEYQEMRARTIEYYNRTPSSNSLGSMANAVEAVKDADRQKQQKQKQKHKHKHKHKQKQKQK